VRTLCAFAFALLTMLPDLGHALEPWQEALVRDWVLDHPGQTPPDIDWSAPTLGTSANDGAWAVDAPPLKYRHVAVYDPVRQRMIVFGGFTVNGNSGGVMNDVWVLSLASATPTWTALTPTGSPPSARYSGSAVYDPVRDRVLLFGGQTSGGPAVNDVWALSLGASPAWTPVGVSGSTPPAPRSGHAAIYDPLRDRMIVCGGVDSGASDQNDVWALALADTVRWSLLAVSGALPARRHHTGS